MSLKIIVLAKQVPDTRNVGKDAMKADGTVNRANKFTEVNFLDAGNDLHPLCRKALDLFAGEQYTFYAVSHT